MTTKTSKGKTRVVYKYHPRPDAYDKSWHLDKKVPIALIVALFVQAAAALSWANSISHSVEQTRAELTELKADVKSNQSKFDSLIELRAEIRALVASISKLERFVDEFREEERLVRRPSK